MVPRAARLNGGHTIGTDSRYWVCDGMRNSREIEGGRQGMLGEKGGSRTEVATTTNNDDNNTHPDNNNNKVIKL